MNHTIAARAKAVETAHLSLVDFLSFFSGRFEAGTNESHIRCYEMALTMMTHVVISSQDWRQETRDIIAAMSEDSSPEIISVVDLIRDKNKGRGQA